LQGWIGSGRKTVVYLRKVGKGEGLYFNSISQKARNNDLLLKGKVFLATSISNVCTRLTEVVGSGQVYRISISAGISPVLKFKSLV